MSEPFHPYQPPKMKKVEITEREEHLLFEMRKHPYGRFTIHKQENRLLRFEVTNSILLEKQDSKARVWQKKKN